MRSGSPPFDNSNTATDSGSGVGGNTKPTDKKDKAEAHEGGSGGDSGENGTILLLI